VGVSEGSSYNARTTMNRLVRSLWLSLLLLGSGFAHAQSDDVAVDPWTPPPDQTGFSMFPSTRTPGPWGFDGMLWAGYAHNPLEARGASLVESRFDTALSVQLGLGGRTAVALRLPAVLHQRGDEASAPFARTLATPALGDPALDARIRVLGAPSRPDGSVEDGAALALRGVVTLPVGTSGSYFADKSVRTELSLITDVEAFGLGAGASLGYRHRFGDPELAGVSVAEQLRLAGGLKIPFPLIAMAAPGKVQESALVEIDVGSDPTDFFAKATTPIEGRLSYRITVGDLTFSLGVGASFTQAYGVPDVRALFGASYSPRVHDQDADGVPDGADQCEHLAEDPDKFEDADGCPEPDNDQDMILDDDDRCPLDPAEIGRDDDEDGCTDK